MATTKKRGRPSTKAQSQVKDKTYRLLGKTTPLSYMLKTGRDFKLLVFDEESKVQRPVRHCPNERTIFADEQSKHAVVEPIDFLHGMLFVKKEQQITQRFLDISPYNAANGGRIFEEVDREKEAKQAIELEEIIIAAKQAIINKSKEDEGIYDLETVTAVLTGNFDEASKMQKESLKRALFQQVDKNPYRFVNEDGEVDIFDDEYIKRKYLAIRAERLGVIERTGSGRSFKFRNGDIFHTAPEGVIAIDSLAEYLGTEKGLLVLGEMQKRL